jgi:hypothetical protein
MISQFLLERLAAQEHQARPRLGAQREFGAAAAEVEHRAGQDRNAVDMGLPGHGQHGVLEVRLQRQAYVRAAAERQVGADEGGVRRPG